MAKLKNKKLILFPLFAIFLFVILNVTCWTIAEAEPVEQNDNYVDESIKFGTLHLHKGKFTENVNFEYLEPSYMIFGNTYIYYNEDIDVIDKDNADIKIMDCAKYPPIMFMNKDWAKVKFAFGNFGIYAYGGIADPGALWSGVVSENYLCINNNIEDRYTYLLSNGLVANAEYVNNQLWDGNDVDLYICGLPKYSVKSVIDDVSKGSVEFSTLDYLPGSNVEFYFSPSSEGNFADFEIKDEYGQSVEIAYVEKNKYSFIMPACDVCIYASTHHVKEFHKKIPQSFTRVGVRAYYVTDEGLYFRANDEYSDAVCKDNSVGTLIGTVDDFNNWKNTYCDEHTTSDGTHYEKGWGGKIPQDM